MASDTAAAGAETECEAMASVDSEQFIIAYPCRDDIWLSVPLTDAASLSEWR